MPALFRITKVITATNHSIHAQFKVKSFTITFNANGGTCTTTSKIVAYNNAYGTLPTPTRANYKFLGWYNSASGGSQVTATTIMGMNNITVYAQWCFCLNTSVGYGGMWYWQNTTGETVNLSWTLTMYITDTEYCGAFMNVESSLNPSYSGWSALADNTHTNQTFIGSTSVPAGYYLIVHTQNNARIPSFTATLQ